MSKLSKGARQALLSTFRSPKQKRLDLFERALSSRLLVHYSHAASLEVMYQDMALLRKRYRAGRMTLRTLLGLDDDMVLVLFLGEARYVPFGRTPHILAFVRRSISENCV